VRFRVGWIDTDASGRIHFSAMFRWLEATEMELYRSLGVLDRSIDLPRRHLEVEYLRKLQFDDEIDVQLEVVHVGRSSVGFGWRTIHEGRVAIVGKHTVVHVDEAGGPAPLDDTLRQELLRVSERRVGDGTVG
jgi:YbgC/YbaW family acyl-CoA thioester hydrolase